MKKKNKRKQAKYPGLDPGVNLRIRKELMECDYLDRLSEEEKVWLNNFNLEYINADFSHEGKRLHKKKIVTKKVKSTGKKRKVDIGKKEVQDSNNKRNVDSFAVTKANRILEYGDKAVGSATERTRTTNLDKTEDVLIDLIDLKNSTEKV